MLCLCKGGNFFYILGSSWDKSLVKLLGTKEFQCEFKMSLATFVKAMFFTKEEMHFFSLQQVVGC